jgi:hypothetical protein
MFILLIDVDDDTRSVVFNDLSLHDKVQFRRAPTNSNVHLGSLGDWVLFDLDGELLLVH